MVNKKCSQLAYLTGFVIDTYYGVGGNSHDGDATTNVCPIESGAHTGIDPLPEKDVDVRSAFVFGLGQRVPDDTFNDERQREYGRIHVENQWCRMYLGPATVADFPGNPALNIPALLGDHFDNFAYAPGERVTFVGDWVFDGDMTEIHEVRMMSVLREQRGTPNAYFLLTSGHFAENTPQVEDMAISVPIPAPPPSNKSWKLYCLAAQLHTAHGCNLVDDKLTSVRPLEIPPGSGNWTCTIQVKRTGCRVARPSAATRRGRTRLSARARGFPKNTSRDTPRTASTPAKRRGPLPRSPSPTDALSAT